MALYVIRHDANEITPPDTAYGVAVATVLAAVFLGTCNFRRNLKINSRYYVN